MVIGIASVGSPVDIEYPAIYTNVFDFVPFIQNIMNSAVEIKGVKNKIRHLLRPNYKRNV